MMTSRRGFLAQVSSGAALGLLAGIPARRLRTLRVSDVIPAADDALLRKLALIAVDAARAGGATFADIRIATGRWSSWAAGVNMPEQGQRPHILWMGMNWESQYGIRVIVDNAWGFAAGIDMTPDAVARTAQTAVVRARANKPRKPVKLELAPAPRVENGSWSSPSEKDPFSVPLGEQAELGLAGMDAASKVPEVGRCIVQLPWYQHTRVFASSEGSLTTQHVTLADGNAFVVANRGEGWANATEYADIYRGQYGYEALGHVDFVAEMKKTAERAVANSYHPKGNAMTSVEVGRYDIVLGGRQTCQVLADTLGETLNLERVLGYRANGSGTSFASPPEELLGRYQLGSPFVTVRADRIRPHAWQTIGWDDEGLKTGEHDLIKNGIIVDYLNSRETTIEAGPRFAARGPGHAQGYMCGIGIANPGIRLPNLTLVPSKDDVSVEDLIKDTKRGLYIKELLGGGTDQQLMTAQYSAVNAGEVFEIRNGKLGANVRDVGFQFSTTQFWKGVAGVGGAKTLVSEDTPLLGDNVFGRSRSMQLYNATVTAPPIRVRDLNIVNLGRTA